MRTNEFPLSCAITGSWNLLLLGYNVGLMDGPLIYVKELKVSPTTVEVPTVILTALSCFASLIVGCTSGCIGRRHSIVLAGAGFFIGRLLMGSSRNYAVLQAGRLFANVGLGYALTITTIYIAEVSPASSRGKLVSFPEVFFNIGTVLGRLSNYFFPKAKHDLGWQIMLKLGAVCSCLLAAGVLAMPESPRWLIMQGRLSEAMRVLKIISDSDEEAELHYNEIKKAVGIPEECNDYIVEVPQQSTGWRYLLLLCRTSSIWHMMICAAGMHCFRHAAGIDTLLQDPRIFSKASIASPEKKLLATMTVDLIKTVSMLFPILLLDRVGRRPLMLFSISGMFFSLVSLGMFLSVFENNGEKLTICIVSTLFYTVFFFIGLAPITSIYSSEIFPLSLRAQGSTVGVAINQGMSLVSSSIFLWLCKEISFGGTIILFATLASMMWLLFYYIMPETRGLTLEEIGKLFGNYSKWRSAAREIEIQRTNRVDGNAIVPRPSLRALPSPCEDYHCAYLVNDLLTQKVARRAMCWARDVRRGRFRRIADSGSGTDGSGSEKRWHR